MTINPDLRIKVRNFFKKNSKLIIVFIVVIMIITIVNKILTFNKKPSELSTTYTPNISVLDSSSEVPKKVSDSFEDFIEQYVIYCNIGDYVKAYNLISDDCKKNYFGNDYDNFVDYVSQKFGSKKRYAIQNYSNYDGKYIYNVKLFNDFLATGLTNEAYRYQEEKMTVSYDENKNIVFSIGNYIDEREVQYMASNEYMKVDVTNVIVKYGFVVYKVKLTNRSDYTIVIQDGNVDSAEISLDVEGEYRPCTENDEIILAPGETKIVNLSFTKFFDTNTKINGIVLNAVRVIENYTGNPETASQEIENALDKFSMTVSF